MEQLRTEIESIQNSDYRLKFRIPTDEELDHMRKIHRELTASEQDRAKGAERGLRSVIEALDRGEISLDDPA